jgi:hypothetical protein
MSYIDTRIKFNYVYNNVITDILLLNEELNKDIDYQLVINNPNLNVDQIHKTTKYQIDFIVHVIDMYNIDTYSNNKLSIKVTKYNIDIPVLKEIGYNDKLINDILKPEIEGENYYFPIE